MFFTLSKLLIYFLFPLTWIIVLIVLACFIKNRKYQQRLIIAAILLLLVFSNGFLLNQFAKIWDVAVVNQSKTTTRYSCAIVLGGFVSEDNNKNGFLNWAADRYIQGIKLKETEKATHLLFTGGSASLKPDGFTEGKWISSELRAFHFQDSTLLFEKRSRNTIENIKFSKILLQSRNLQPPYLLVTSAFHMRRALLICKKAGVQVVPYPCNYFAGKGSISVDNFIPSAEALANWNIYLKELVGYAVTAIKT